MYKYLKLKLFFVKIVIWFDCANFNLKNKIQDWLVTFYDELFLVIMYILVSLVDGVQI